MWQHTTVAPNRVKCEVSNRHVKKQESTAHDESAPSAETELEGRMSRRRTLEAFITAFPMFKESSRIRDIKKCPDGTFRDEAQMHEKKRTRSGISDRSDPAEERRDELEDTAVGTLRKETQKEKRKKQAHRKNRRWQNAQVSGGEVRTRECGWTVRNKTSTALLQVQVHNTPRAQETEKLHPNPS